MNCRILKNKEYIITNSYNNNHQAVDIVGKNNKVDIIVSHSDGQIIFFQDGYGNMKGSIGNMSYGNCVKIRHQDGYDTLYAHMQNGLFVKNNQYIKKGEAIGYISDSGNAYGKHLHFEVWKNNQRINPLEYLDKSFSSTIIVDEKYKIGDIVEINGVYISSTSKEKLRPLINSGKITKIIENANNPYLLEDGNIGWANDNTITRKIDNNYLYNNKYQGVSIVEALNQINVDSSFNNRSKLANINNITNYYGSAEQNLKLLDLLKQGKLKY